MSRTISKVLIIGSGANQITHSTEYDTATLQIASHLKSLGIDPYLIDNDPFSVSLSAKDVFTDTSIAAVNLENVVAAIDQFNPDAIIPNLGGLISLRVAQELFENKILANREITMLSLPEAAIRQINNPVLLNQTLTSMGAPITTSETIASFGEALKIVNEIGFPVIIKPVSPIANSSRRLCHDNDELAEAVEIAISQSKIQQAMLTQSIVGYQEIELVVIRDRLGSMLQVAGIEDFDAVGVHAGDSIAFTPTQTLMDQELQELRDLAFSITRKLRIVGVNHVQFALDPKTGRYYVIKNSPYFDRMTAFSQIATGYPLAFVCANLLMGKTLEQLELPERFGFRSALLEPAMDHIAVRFPTWPDSIVANQNLRLGTQMKSTGSVIGIGRSTEEALIKAIRASHTQVDSLTIDAQQSLSDDQLIQYIIHPRANRLLILLEALRRGYSTEELGELTKIDEFFFYKLTKLLELETEIAAHPSDLNRLKKAKYFGFSDRMIASLWNQQEREVSNLVTANLIQVTYKEIEFSAGEFELHTGQFYSTFELESDSHPSDKHPKALIVGSGGLKLGNSSASDFFTTALIRMLTRQGTETILINNNPVANSMNFADKTYIEPIEAPDIFQVIQLEKPDEIYVAGQRTLLTNLLQQRGLNVIQFPGNGDLHSHLANGKEYAVTMLFDGHNVQSLGVTSYLVQDETGFGDPTAFVYPAHLNHNVQQELFNQGAEQIGQQTQPGIYQALFVVTNRAHFEQVRLLPITELAFLTKALQLNLVEISLELTKKRLPIPAVGLAQPKRKVFAYSATFPFKLLRVADEEVDIESVLGAEMAVGTDVLSALKPLSDRHGDNRHKGV